ncbi:AraC family transcriptional regulator [Piscirickettsia litoralis]|uniref:AraC family transcriptional regulator n=1 Tax=Piscirickettsia litoralis TaxID=1891921 RepID=A0ABX3A6F9_9GAMM|nr:AraC family transcriptional regulator [Piscirickettsia litoralis]ODN43030.1 AraC family transcriptional regulator [Piscirickettsia litoralis]
MSERAAKKYTSRMNEVFRYINEHLYEELTVEQLAEVANFSKYHFHRQFCEYAGINVFQLIRLMRLKRASYQLVFNKQCKVIDIALDAGFENPESFSRAFKKAFGQTPTQFRQQPKWQPWLEKYILPEIKREQVMQVDIIDFKKTAIIAIEHHGTPELINDTASRFLSWIAENKLPVRKAGYYGIAYNDPNLTAPEDFRFDFGLVTAGRVKEENNIINKVIPAGRCARVRHLGSHDHIGDSVRALYGKWLPGSGEELRDFPCFFNYLNMITDVAEHELMTDIYLPLK